MTRAVIKSLAVGVGAALLCLVIAFAGESLFAPRFLHRTNIPVARTTPPPKQSADPDTFTVTTDDRVESITETSWNDPYTGPMCFAVLIVVSSWTFVRLRRSTPNAAGSRKST